MRCQVANAIRESKATCGIRGLFQRKENQIFCSAGGCESLVKAAMRDAKAQGPHQLKAFQALRRMGGAKFIDGLMQFKSRCQGSGRGHRRPHFAWARLLMIIEDSTVVDKGAKQVWLSKKKIITFLMAEEEGLTYEQGQLRWHAEVAAGRPKGKVSPDNKLLFPIERFLVSYSRKARREELQMGCKETLICF